ncbi:MAG: GNAT family N-acetyltransferase [Thermomicrobiales bacterium]
MHLRPATDDDLPAILRMAEELGREDGAAHGIGTNPDWARDRGADRLAVGVFAANAQGIRFYERVGFASYEVVMEQPVYQD